MLPREALDILGLTPRATPAEIKEAYRDLVKVWHPDRFVDDARLHKKAEDKLKQLNQAYQTLRSNPATGASDTHKPASAAPTHRPPPPPPRPYRPIPRNRSVAAQKKAIRRALIFYTAIAIALVALVMFALYVAHLNDPEQVEIHPTALLPPSQRSFRTLTPGESRPQPDAPPVGQPRQGNSGATSGADSSVTSPFHVRALSDPETAQLESACSGLRELPNSTAYQTCLKAQLDAITNAPGKPDLSTLSTQERESIESACSEAAAHDRCLTVQMAELAASPARPDLSGLSDDDRAVIESACVAAKTRGPAAYNRCRIRLVKLLADSR